MSCNDQAVCGFNSQVETKIVYASGEPAPAEATKTIQVNGETGLLVNQHEEDAFSGPIPLAEYPINKDFCPTVITKPSNCVECSRDVSVKYLEPGAVATPGPIIINQVIPFFFCLNLNVL